MRQARQASAALLGRKISAASGTRAEFGFAQGLISRVGVAGGGARRGGLRHVQLEEAGKALELLDRIIAWRGWSVGIADVYKAESTGASI